MRREVLVVALREKLNLMMKTTHCPTKIRIELRTTHLLGLDRKKLATDYEINELINLIICSTIFIQ